MNRTALAALIALPLALATLPAFANVSFDYTSGALDGPGFPTSFLTVSATFNDAGTKLLSWSVADPLFGSLSSTDADSRKLVGNITIVTDWSGAVTSWSVGIEKYPPSAGAGIEYMYTENEPGSGPLELVLGNSTDGRNNASVRGTSSGTWTASTPLANRYLIGNVPEPANVALLLAGLGLVGLKTRRRG